MSPIAARFVRILASASLVLVLSGTGFGQITLRNALDFDGDDKADLAVFRRENATWIIWGSSNNYLLFQPWGIANEDRLVPGDYDGDGRGDLAVWRDSNASWHILTTSNFTYTGGTWGLKGDEPVARDYDGDGKTDVAVVRRSGGQMVWWVLKSKGGFASVQWGAVTDYAVPGDYDGDGMFDFAVQRPGPTPTSQAFFHILGSQYGYFGVPWGWSSDFAVPGDYDGDDKTDVAIVRPGAAATDGLDWAILRSDGGGYMFTTFGLSGDDYTAQGDYDGDGKTDVAVWRQSNGFFYVLQSSIVDIAGAPWGTAGDIPVASYDTH